MTTDTETQLPRTPSYWKVGLVLLGLVVVVLVGAVLLTRQLRPRVGIAPVVTGGRVTSVPSGSPHGGQPSRSTAPPAAVSATHTGVAPTPRPSRTLTPRQAVMLAYHRYWQRYSQALYTLNASLMRDVAAGEELREARAEVADLRRRNDAVRVRVSHHALLVAIKGNTATIYDEIVNRSFIIDPVTKLPPHGSNQVDVEKDTYYLTKIGGVWKVTKTLRQKG